MDSNDLLLTADPLNENSDMCESFYPIPQFEHDYKYDSHYRKPPFVLDFKSPNATPRDPTSFIDEETTLRSNRCRLINFVTS